MSKIVTAQPNWFVAKPVFDDRGSTAIDFELEPIIAWEIQKTSTTPSNVLVFAKRPIVLVLFDDTKQPWEPSRYNKPVERACLVMRPDGKVVGVPGTLRAVSKDEALDQITIENAKGVLGIAPWRPLPDNYKDAVADTLAAIQKNLDDRERERFGDCAAESPADAAA